MCSWVVSIITFSQTEAQWDPLLAGDAVEGRREGKSRISDPNRLTSSPPDPYKFPDDDDDDGAARDAGFGPEESPAPGTTVSSPAPPKTNGAGVSEASPEKDAASAATGKDGANTHKGGAGYISETQLKPTFEGKTRIVARVLFNFPSKYKNGSRY